MKYLTILLLVGSVFGADGKVFVSSEPKGAEIISANGNSLGRTPCIINLPIGEQVLGLVLANHESRTVKVKAISGEIIKSYTTLVPSAPPNQQNKQRIDTKSMHKLSIIILDDGWSIFIDSKPILNSKGEREMAPAVVDVTNEDHKISLVKPGFFPIEKQVCRDVSEIEFSDIPKKIELKLTMIKQKEIKQRLTYFRIVKTNADINCSSQHPLFKSSNTLDGNDKTVWTLIGPIGWIEWKMKDNIQSTRCMIVGRGLYDKTFIDKDKINSGTIMINDMKIGFNNFTRDSAILLEFPKINISRIKLESVDGTNNPGIAEIYFGN